MVVYIIYISLYFFFLDLLNNLNLFLTECGVFHIVTFFGS